MPTEVGVVYLELFRVLRSKGFAILKVPISKNEKGTFKNLSISSLKEREKYFGQKDHVRIYSQDYKRRLKNVSFKVELYDIKKDLNIKYLKRYDFNENEIIYVCRKL